MFSGLSWVCLPKWWNFRTGRYTKCLRQESQFENQRAWSHFDQFSNSIALCSKLNDEFTCLRAALNLNAKYCWRYMQLGEKLRRPALHAIIIPCGIKWARIAPPNTLTDSYTQFLLEKFNRISTQWLGQPNPYHTILHYRSIPCLNTLLDNVCFFYSLLHYIVELYTKFLHCWAIPNPNTMLTYDLFYYTAEQLPISIHSWAIPHLSTLSIYGRS